MHGHKKDTELHIGLLVSQQFKEVYSLVKETRLAGARLLHCAFPIPPKKTLATWPAIQDTPELFVCLFVCS